MYYSKNPKYAAPDCTDLDLTLFWIGSRNTPNTSDAIELEIGELSRAEPSWIFPSQAELVGFRNRAEPSWIFLERSWIRAEFFWVTTFFVSNKFFQKVLYGHKFQVYWCFLSIVLSDFLVYQINKGIKSNFDNVLLFLTIFQHASWIL